MSFASDPGPLAAIDIGSNSFRLEIGAFERGRYRRLDYVKDVVRLGGGLDADGLLREDAAQRGLDSLHRFAERLRGFEAHRVRAVATQTLRQAANRNAFLDRASGALGHPVEVISGREEARLIYAGVGLLQPSMQRRLVVDIGGLSTELIVGRGRRPREAESFQIGSVGLSLRCFADGRLSAAAFRDAQIAAGAEFEEGLALFSPDRWSVALGSSGTVGALSQIVRAAGLSDGTITPASLRWCIARCIEAGHVDALQLPSLKDSRRPVIAGGLAILYTAMVHFGIEAMAPAAGALRHGVLADLHDRLSPPPAARRHDTRHASVREVQRRFAVDTAQARRVQAVARHLHAALDPDADDEARRELDWACALHETGMQVSHHDHHRHGAYLVGHVDAAGLSQTQQRRLADLVLGQRGGLRKIESTLADPVFVAQLLCLRLAVIACHARGPVDARAWSLQRDGAGARLRYGRRWASMHPRTLHLLQQEATAWSRSGVLAFELPG